MKNKENIYKEEIFELLSDDLKQITDDSSTHKLIKSLFMADEKDINNEDVINKLIKE